MKTSKLQSIDIKFCTLCVVKYSRASSRFVAPRFWSVLSNALLSWLVQTAVSLLAFKILRYYRLICNVGYIVMYLIVY
jgi:hypothetical protein